ncbi:tetratricopeptide repeat protein [bacterium]|nr:tetratricopeptide repeat protein [bacterium]
MSAPVGQQEALPSDLSRALRRRHAAGESELFVPLAELARREGRSQESLALLEAGLREWPRRVSGWVALARLKAQLGRMDEALGHYRELLEGLDPHNLPALRALAGAALARGELASAGSYLQRWRAEDPEDPELGDLCEELAALRGGWLGAGGAEQTATEGLLAVELGSAAAGYLAAPSPADGQAWAAASAGRKGS